MARMNSRTGNYGNASVPLNAKDMEKALKGLKIKTPNRKMSTQAYKSGLPKIAGSTP